MFLFIRRITEVAVDTMESIVYVEKYYYEINKLISVLLRVLPLINILKLIYVHKIILGK